MSGSAFTFGTGYGTQKVTSEPLASAQPVAAGGDADLIKDTTTQTFAKDVMDASRSVPVLVDFWAPWCGPCKQLTPILEKTVRAYKGKVKLVKMNIDDHPQIAGQLGIQSIPAVIAFVDGRPADGFMGAVPEGQLKSFIDRLVGPGGNDVDAMLEAANTVLASGDAEGAGELFSAVLAEDGENVAAITGLARVFVAHEDLERAKEVLMLVPPAKVNDPLVAAVRAQIELAEQAASLGDTREFEARLAVDANDHQARLDLALALAAKGDAKAAVDQLIEIVRRDRSWNEDAGRKQLVTFFDAWGATDPNTLYGRRRLSSVLFS